MPTVRRSCAVLIVAVAAFVPAASASPARLVRHQSDAIPGEYIVVLKGSPAMTSERMIATGGIEVKHRYGAALRGFTGRMSEARALELLSDPEVDFIEENTRVHVTDQFAPPWGLDRIDQRALPLDHWYTDLGDGSGVTAYVIDTGVRVTHRELAGRVGTGAFVVEDGRGVDDCTGHGTHVAGIIGGTTFGVAKRVEIVPVRVLDCRGSASNADVIAGIDYVTANHRLPAVANISIGGTGNAAEDQAVRNLIASGVTVVVAAGNDGVDACLTTPARTAEAITVGAVDATDRRASFSNWGSCVDLHGPGVQIESAGIANDLATATLSGTSMAAPHVTGIVAAYLSLHPTASPAMVASALIQGATTGRVTDLNGSPDRLLNSLFLDPTPPVVELVSPQEGAVVPRSFVVEARLADANPNGMDLEVDGVLVDAVAEGPYEFRVEGLADGNHVLRVIGYDRAGQSAQQTATIHVGDGPDAPTIPESDETTVGGCSAGSGGTKPGALLTVVLAMLTAARRRRSSKIVRNAALVSLMTVAACAADAPPTREPTELDAGLAPADPVPGQGTSIVQCSSTENQYTIRCSRSGAFPATCSCLVKGAEVRTCTTTSSSSCSFLAGQNCCGF